MPDTTRDRYVNHTQEAWRALVNFAFLCPADRRQGEIDSLARRIGAPAVVVKKKVEAILACREVGMSQPQIIEAGQTTTLARKKPRVKGESQRIVSWRIPRSLADAVKPDNGLPESTESFQSRCIRVLQLRTSEDFWEFMLSCFADLTDTELRNLAGVYLDRKTKKLTV